MLKIKDINYITNSYYCEKLSTEKFVLNDTSSEKIDLEFTNSKYRLIIKQLSEPSEHEHYAIIILENDPVVLHSIDIWTVDPVKKDVLLENDKNLTCISLQELIKECLNEYIALKHQYLKISEPEHNQKYLNQLDIEKQELELQKNLQKDFDAGMSIKELCNKYNVSQPTLNRKYGIQKNMGHERVIPLEMLDEIRIDFKAGMSIKELCIKYNVSQPTLNKYGIKKGTHKKRRGKMTTEILTAIQNDLRSGKTLKEVCEYYEVSRVTLHNYGIKKRS